MSLRKIEKFFLGATLFCIPFAAGAIFDTSVSAKLLLVQDLFLAVTYMMWLNRTNLFSRAHSRLGSVGALVLLMMFWCVISMIGAIALRAAGVGIYFTLKAFFLYFYLVNNIRTKSDLLFVVNMLVYSLLFQGVLGTLQGALKRTLGLGFLGESQMSLQKIDSRVRGTMGYPNRYGAIVILLLPLAISMAIFVRRSLYKWVLIAASGFGLMALFLSLSRSSWAGFFCAIAVMVVLLIRRRMLKPKIVVAIACVMIAVAIIAVVNWDVIEVRFERGADGKFRSRMIDIAIPIIKDHLIFGVGLNNYQWHSYDAFQFWHPVHNEFLRFAAEIGIPGAILFTAILLLFLREAYKNIMVKDQMINAVAIGIFGSIIAFIVAINIGPEYQHYRIKLAFWALAGIIFSLRQVRVLEIKMKKQMQQKQHGKANMKTSRERVVTTNNHLLPAQAVRRL